MHNLDMLKSLHSSGYILVPFRRDRSLGAYIKFKKMVTQSWGSLKGYYDKWGKECDWAVSAGPSGVVAIDIDTKGRNANGEDGLEQFLGCSGLSPFENGPNVQRTPSGGYHIIYRVGDDLAMQLALGELRPRSHFFGCGNVEIKSSGRLFHVCPSEGYSLPQGVEGIHKDLLPDFPPEWIEKAFRAIETEEVEEVKASQHEDADPPIYTKDYIHYIVKEIKGCALDYHQWIQCGMAIHSWDSGPSGMELFCDLTHNEAYQDGDELTAMDKWATFEEGNITIKTLGHIARSMGIYLKGPTSASEDFEGCWEEREGEFFSDDKDFVVDWMNQKDLFYCRDASFAENKRFIRIREVQDLMRVITHGSSKGIEDMYPGRFFEYQQGKSLKVKNAARVWAESNRRKEVEGMTFNPRGTDLVLNNKVNLFAGIPISKYREAGTDRVIWDMIYESICGEDNKKFTWFMQWVAHIFQRPWEKPTIFPVIIGPQGTGKGFLTERILGGMLNHLFFITSSTKDIVGFNSMMGRKLLICLNEATWKNKHDLNNMLKAFTGDNKIVIDGKYQPKYEIENYSRFIITSNSYDAIKYEMGNRRIIFLENGTKWTRNKSKFNALKKELTGNNLLGKFYNSLMTHDLKGFNPYDICDLDYGGEEAKLQSLGPVAEFWLDVRMNPRPIFHRDRGFDGPRTFNEFLIFCQNKTGLTPRTFWKETRSFLPQIGGSKTFRMRSATLRIYPSRLIRVIESVDKFLNDRLNPNCDAIANMDLEGYYVSTT